MNNVPRNFRLSIILLFAIGFGFGIYDELNPYIFPSQVALYLDEIDYLPSTTFDTVHFFIFITIYICLFFFIPFSNYALIIYILFYSLVDTLIINDDVLQIYSPLFQNILDIIYMIFGVQIYMMFFTNLRDKFKLKKK